MGVLSGIRVVEFEAIGPAPFGAMMLADMGADVLRIDRPVAHHDLGVKVAGERVDITGRGKRSVTLDLKSPHATQAALELIDHADVVIEGFRPGTMERLGLGPDIALKRNPGLVYARMTGWGQNGPLAATAGHDLNYIALSGVLSAIGEAGGPPVPPLNVVGDYGGGGMLLVCGVLGALLHVQRGGSGQVVDAAMTEGAAQLASVFWGMVGSGNWLEARGSNQLDGGAPWYGNYRTRDGQYMSVAAVEGRFFTELLDKLGLSAKELPDQHDRRGWPQLREAMAQVFATRPRDEWSVIFEGSNACAAPVLTFSEAPTHPHARDRGSFMTVGGVVQPSPAPRFTGVPSATPAPAPQRGQGGDRALSDWGFDAESIDRLQRLGLGFTAAAGRETAHD